MGSLLAATMVPSRGVAKLVKALDFDSSIRRFDSFHPCQIIEIGKLKLRNVGFCPKMAGLCLKAGAENCCQVCVATGL